MLNVPAFVVLIISRLPSLNVLVNMLHSSRTARMRQLASLVLNKDDRSPAGALPVRQPEPAQATQASRGRGRDVEVQCRDYWADAAYLFSYLNAHKTKRTQTHQHTNTHAMHEYKLTQICTNPLCGEHESTETRLRP